MSIGILIIGDSGTGKSTSLRTLDPKETFIINVVNKNLPFKGANKNYIKCSKDNPNGNIFYTDNPVKIKEILSSINLKRQDIKNIVIDDFGYVIMNDFMKKALIKGYDKYTEIAKSFSEIIDSIKTLRDDIFCFVMMHSETDKHGKTKPKTVGNMIDQYVCIEGNFTHVFHTIVSDKRYKFITNNDGIHMAKTPLGMFDDLYIDNDLNSIKEKIYQYYNDDIS